MLIPFSLLYLISGWWVNESEVSVANQVFNVQNYLISSSTHDFLSGRNTSICDFYPQRKEQQSLAVRNPGLWRGLLGPKPHIYDQLYDFA